MYNDNISTQPLNGRAESRAESRAENDPIAENEPRAETELGERAETEAVGVDVARGHVGDGVGDDRPPAHHIPTGCGGSFVNQGKGTHKPNLGRKAGRLHTRQETRNLGLKKITDDKGPEDDFVLPFLAEGPGGAEGSDHDKDW
ncbi:hypothetical protein Tco_0711518, partial [Tanacetum coccineum]